ncbi:MAG: response regulator [Patescibacteria group bacterium]|nr:response regulator [Patescibacteria group bacterium]
MKWKNRKKSLSGKMAGYFFVCSICFAFIGAVLHVLFEHDERLDHIDTSVHRIEERRVSSIVYDVENGDIKSLKDHLLHISEAIHSIGYIAVVNDNDAILTSRGLSDSHLVVRKVKLVSNVMETEKNVGTLIVGFDIADMRNIFFVDFAKYYVIQIIQGICVMIVIFIFVRHRMVKPLKVMINNVSSIETIDLLKNSDTQLFDQGLLNRSDEIGYMAKAISAMRDRLKRSLCDLHESELYSQLLIDNVPIATLVVRNAKIVFCNQYARDLFAIGDDLIIGTMFIDHVDPDSRSIIASCHDSSISIIACDHCAEEDCERAREEFCVTISGTEEDKKYARVVFVKNKRNTKSTRLVFLKDVTEEVRLQNEQKMLNRRIMRSQKMESLGTLVGGIAHDFNNILTGIMGFAQLAKIKSTEQEVIGDIDIVFGASKRAQKLISQLLTFCRTGQSQDKSVLRVNDMATEVVELLSSTVPSTIEFKIVTTSAGKVLADVTQIHQLLMNLCVNGVHAIQHTDVSNVGLISIELQDVHLTSADASLFLHISMGDFVKIVVKDDGCGMTDEVIDRIFDPHFTTKDVGKGTGMGLAVSYGIVMDNDGDIAVYSTIGKGTRFEVFLPITEKEIVGKNVEICEPGTVCGTGMILLVDDEIINTGLFESTLEGFGYKTHVSNFPREAFDYFITHRESIDCIVTDLIMPEINGITLARMIREVDPVIPIILCTGCLEAQDKSDIKEAGINEVLYKPVDGVDIAAAICRHVS